MEGGEMEWVVRIKDELARMGDTSTEREQWQKRSIYRVPPAVTDLNKIAYKPQTVSFGPYHHGKEHLKPMEEHKHRALLHFLKRSNKPLESYVDSLAQVVDDLKHSYDCLDPSWQEDTDAFLQVMVLDGCFMLEILRKATAMSDQDQTTHPRDDYASNDPIFSNHGKLYLMPYIKRDMLMLENQLPILLLKKLLAVSNDNSNPQHDEEFLNKLILKFCSSQNACPAKLGKCLHVLDVYRKCLLWEDPNRRRKVRAGHVLAHHEEGGGDEIIRSATELNEAGIRFKKSKTGSLQDISFRSGVLKLPLIVVDDATESMFLNLIAFERFHVGAGNEVTSYIFFMDNIIDSARDVSLLHSQGIIQNAIGSDKAVAKLFNSLSKDITLDPNSALDVVHKKVHHYCRKPWNEWRANLIHTYFRSPWAILSVLAAVLLFALTIIQTIYTIFPRDDSSSVPSPPAPHSRNPPPH